MHIVLLLLLIGTVVYLYLKSNSPSDASRRGTHGSSPWSEGSSDYQSAHRIAFISKGKLFFQDAGNGLKELHSPYVQGVMDRMERARQRHAWKEGTAFETSYVGNRSNVPSEQLEVRATSAQFTPSGKMLYFLRDERVGGLFEYDFDTGNELRLIHQQNMLLEDLALDADGQRILCSQRNANGTANIGLMNADGGDYRDVTGGDTLDTAPAWVPEEARQVVFQSSGVARSEEGYVVALGPASLQMLDTDKGDLSVVLEDEQFDFLQPKVCPAGNLHYIRRPYEPPKYDGGNFLLDLLLFPFRLLRALFHFLNFFSLMYSRKPLTSAGGPELQADLKEMMVKGKRIDAEKALRKESRVNGVRSLVPRSWQLMCRNRQGQDRVLATNVAAYDIAADGTVVYTNGYGVFALNTHGAPEVVLRDKLIADVVAGQAS